MSRLTRVSLDENNMLKKSSVYGVPIGTIILHAAATAPAGTLVCDGSAISRTTYADLFAAIGTTYGAGDGSTTFNLPDVRDEFPRFNGTSRTVGTTQTDAIRNFTGILHNMAFDGTPNGVQVEGIFHLGGNEAETRYYQVQTTGTYFFRQSILCYASYVVPTANENRPRNIAFLGCIIYQ